MSRTPWSRARRKPLAARGLRSAYQFLASSASASACGCQISSFEATEEPLSHVRPGNRLNGPGLQFLDTPSDFHVPGLFSSWIRWVVEALDQGADDRRPIPLIQRKRLLQDVFCGGAHGAQYTAGLRGTGIEPRQEDDTLYPETARPDDRTPDHRTTDPLTDEICAAVPGDLESVDAARAARAAAAALARGTELPRS